MGATGRLRVGIAGGPSGYFYNDEATRIFFKQGYFYTGDLAVMREDGRMALMGRITDVLNVSGNKVSPIELEAKSSALLDGRTVCLFSLPGETGGENLHAVVETSQPIDAERLAAVFGATFDNVASISVLFLDRFPRNAVGKILRAELRANVVASPEHTLIIEPMSRR